MASLIKMQVYLDQARYHSFKSMAKKLKVSMAQLVREWIDEKTENRKTKKLTKDPFWKCVGRGDSGADDIAQRFDDYLYGGKK